MGKEKKRVRSLTDRLPAKYRNIIGLLKQEWPKALMMYNIYKVDLGAAE